MGFRPRGIHQSLDSGVAEPQSFNLDPYVGYTFRELPILDADGIIDHLTTGATQSAPSGVITYTFSVANHIVGQYNNPNAPFYDTGYGYSRFTPEQEAAARTAIALWDDLIPQSFVEQRGLGNADITLANSLDPAQAYAFYPYDRPGLAYSGDLFTNDPNVDNWSNNWFTYGGYGTTTLIHELGHTLGLSHPGDYNYDPDLDLTYDNYAEYAQDSEQYTIMSYWPGDETGNRVVQWNTFQYSSAETPMLHDILAIQSQYGADPTTRVGDTVYGFGSTAGRDVFDFAKNPFPYLSVYDAGGTDTINLSGFTVGQFLDLHAGSFSSIGAGAPSAATVNQARDELFALAGAGNPADYTQDYINGVINNFRIANADAIATDTGVGGIYATEYDNFSIAYGVTIENAIGGSARDLLWGNEVANRLEGRGGSDVLNGFEGDDVLIGGAGGDTLFGGTGNDRFVFDTIEKTDVIMDWNAGDRIDLSQIDAKSTQGGMQHFTFIGGGAFTGTAGQLHYVGGVLEGDINGDGVADFAVTLSGSPLIGAGDLLLG